MSRGLSRQQVAILLFIRQAEEGCYSEYQTLAQGKPCRCGRPRPEGKWGCYQCHLRWCPRCQPSAIHIAAHFWPKPPEPSGEFKAKVETDPAFRAWVQGLGQIAAQLPCRRRFYVNHSHHVSILRALHSLERRRLISWWRRSHFGYMWGTRWHPTDRPSTATTPKAISVASLRINTYQDATLVEAAP